MATQIAADNKMPNPELSPFKAGDHVVYAPSSRGHGLAANDPPDARLQAGRAYLVAEVQQGRYIVVEGYSHPGGGLHWSEFRRAE
jgi:hypothetical protein